MSILEVFQQLKILVDKGSDYIIYQVFDYEDMINIASANYGDVIGKWCIAGRYPTSQLTNQDIAKTGIKSRANES